MLQVDTAESMVTYPGSQASRYSVDRGFWFCVCVLQQEEELVASENRCLRRKWRDERVTVYGDCTEYGGRDGAMESGKRRWESERREGQG